MATTHTPGTGIAFRTAQPGQFRQIGRVPGVMALFEAGTGLSKNEITPEEYREIVALDDFLTRHIQPDSIRDVQCMLLWSEWVRIFRKQTHRFPKMILENEFRTVITNQLGADITHDTFRGAVYTGIRFVP